MALTDESMVMPVAPMNGNGGFGGFGGDWSSWIVLFLLFGMFGAWGNGGFGGGFGGYGNAQLSYDFPWLLQGQQGINANTNNGFRDAMLNDGITSVRDGINGLSTQLCGCCGDMQMAVANGFAGTNLGIANSTSAIQNALCNGFNGVNNSIFGAQTAIGQQLNTNEIANLNRSFAEQTANMHGFNGVNTGVADLKYTVASENCADRAALSDGIRDLLAATQAQTQTILTQMCNDKIEQKNDIISQLRSELLYARGQASQDIQTSVIQAGQRALANEVEQYVAPKAVPSYIGQNPNCCANYTGCGCGVA